MENFGISCNLNISVEDFVDLVDQFSENTNYGYSVEEVDGELAVNIEILPYFPIIFKFKEDYTFMEVKTSFFGLGFHILILDFIDELREFIDCEIVVKDDTNYYNNKKIDELQDKFEKWIIENSKFILNNIDDKITRSIFMSNEKDIPYVTEEYIATYRGIITVDEFKELYDLGLENIKNNVFVFPNKIEDMFSEEGYLLYHIWNNLKDLTLVDDFDERVSLTMFMFENVINNQVKIHLPQKFAREIYKYLGVDGFSASNFVYRKVKYEIGYHLYDSILMDYNFKFIIPAGFSYNKKLKTYDNLDNSIFITQYFSEDEIDFNSEISETFSKDDFKVNILGTDNLNSPFLGYKIDDEDDYIPLKEQANSSCELTVAKVDYEDRVFEVVVYGVDSLNIIKNVIGI